MKNSTENKDAAASRTARSSPRRGAERPRRAPVAAETDMPPETDLPPKKGMPADEAKAAEAEAEPRRLRYEGLPLVVIAGRPNVGKSTLFNRLLHKRRAITDPTPGVTRDPIEAECLFRDSGKRFRLVDTGGFKLEREGLDGLVVEKSLASLERADLVIFLVDAKEATPEDEEFAQLLRRWSDKVLLVVNKADSPERDALVWAHLRWGFGTGGRAAKASKAAGPSSVKRGDRDAEEDPAAGGMIFISAEHGRNIDELEEAIISRLDFTKIVAVDVERAPIRLAILGKPNTGKSTLLNRLLGEDKSIVSDMPGTTRDPVEGRFSAKKREFRVLDTAGIRRKSKVRENVEYYSVTRAIKSVEDCDVVVHMIDASEGLTDQDKKIAAFASEAGRGVVFVLNKWDEMPDIKNSFEAARDKLRYFFGQMAWAPVLPLSARDGIGIDKLISTIITVHAQLTKEIGTGPLMRAVEAWIEATPPPVGPKTRWKLRYAVQTSSNPQRFTFFVTRPEAVAEAYRSFLRNQIREGLGLDKVPVLLELKASRQGWVERKESMAAATEKAATRAAGPKAPITKAPITKAEATKSTAAKVPGSAEGAKRAPAKRAGAKKPVSGRAVAKAPPKSTRVKPAQAKKAQKPENRRAAAKQAKAGKGRWHG
ncbi:MAG TPA: ribosome biogenesis GTPase Der [Rectinemataceae bacterium]|nr:ribosome biogenesis GTPase Der [Rectinemataceae bacterium]